MVAYSLIFPPQPSSQPYTSSLAADVEHRPVDQSGPEPVFIVKKVQPTPFESKEAKLSAAKTDNEIKQKIKDEKIEAARLEAQEKFQAAVQQVKYSTQAAAITASVAPIIESVTSPVAAVAEVPAPSPAPPVVSELLGQMGWVSPGNNCVAEPGVNNPGQGNPISWPVSSATPWVGATALFWYNHTGVVTGLWNGGDVEVRHQNCPGCPHRYPLSAFRGFR